jgi:hypothetical protein
MQKDNKQKTIYYINSAKPIELEYILFSLTPKTGLARDFLRLKILEKFNYNVQKRFGDSINRLEDLDIIIKEKAETICKLTEFGEKIRELLQYEVQLYREIIHFLHYQGYNYSARKREYLWSYRKLCELLWNRSKVGRHNELAAKVTGCIQEYFGTTHVPFDDTIIGKFLTWIKPLQPQVIDNKGNIYQREINRAELFLLSIDLCYREKNLQYGDPILLTEDIIDGICRTFFINPNCFNDLLDMSKRFYADHLRLMTGFQGTSLILKKSFSVTDLI